MSDMTAAAVTAIVVVEACVLIGLVLATYGLDITKIRGLGWVGGLWDRVVGAVEHVGACASRTIGRWLR